MNGDFTSLDCRFFWFEFVSSYSNLFFPLIWILNCWTQFSLLFINMITYYNPEYYLNRTLMHRIHFALTLFLVKGTPVQRAAVCQFVFSYSTTFCTHTHTFIFFSSSSQFLNETKTATTATDSSNWKGFILLKLHLCC